MHPPMLKCAGNLMKPRSILLLLIALTLTITGISITQPAAALQSPAPGHLVITNNLALNPDGTCSGDITLNYGFKSTDLAGRANYSTDQTCAINPQWQIRSPPVTMPVLGKHVITNDNWFWVQQNGNYPPNVGSWAWHYTGLRVSSTYLVTGGPCGVLPVTSETSEWTYDGSPATGFFVLDTTAAGPTDCPQWNKDKWWCNSPTYICDNGSWTPTAVIQQTASDGLSGWCYSAKMQHYPGVNHDGPYVEIPSDYCEWTPESLTDGVWQEDLIHLLSSVGPGQSANFIVN